METEETTKRTSVKLESTSKSEYNNNNNPTTTTITTSKDQQDSSEKDSSSEGSVEDQLDDDEEFGTKASPYHLIGFCCFCSSIIIGITCVLSTTLLLADHSASNSQLKFVYGILFGAFLCFLFMCLCCTYYLGASKESWETPTFSGIRRNFTNFVAIAGLVVEFVQICSFSFNPTRLFSGVDVGNVNYIAVPVGDNVDFFLPVYWLMFVIAFTPYIFVIIIRVIIYVYTIKKGEAAAANIVERYQEKIHSVLWFLVNTLYFPVIGTMVSGTDCTYTKDEITLDAHPEIHCLKGKHIAILICSMLALVIYYPAASFAQAQTQSISDIKFKPRIVFIMLQGKFVIALISIYFTSNFIVYYTGLLVGNLMFLVLNVFGRPCLVMWVNQMRTIFFAMSLWATFCAGVVGTWIISDEHSKVPAILLLVGWALMLVLFPLFFIFWNQIKPLVLNTVKRFKQTKASA